MLYPDGRPYKNKKVTVTLKQDGTRVSRRSILIRNDEYTFRFIPSLPSKRYKMKVRGESESTVSENIF